ncbi:MAG: hypothetical protein ACREIT_11490, partial [Tepidisphaeraceae bacterium]
MDPVWTIVFGVVALLTRVGLAMYASGTSRSKNAAGAVLRNVCDLCVAVLAAWAVGGRLPTWLGARESLVGTWALTFFATTLIATGVFAGTVAERSRFFPICAASALLAG